MRIALGQINTVAGNVPANTASILAVLSDMSTQRVDLVVFPELSIAGYPPRDLLDQPGFLAACDSAVTTIWSHCKTTGIAALVGVPTRNLGEGKKPLRNSAVLILPGSDAPRYAHKKLLPTYDIFDEARHFQPAPPDDTSGLLYFPVPDDCPIILGVTICEDIWNDAVFWKDERRYESDPVEQLVNLGADIIVNLSASPYTQGKPSQRRTMLQHSARRWNKPVLIVNQVGGNDQVVFDGNSCIINPDGSVAAHAGAFQESTVIADYQSNIGHFSSISHQETAEASDLSEIQSALQLGLGDYLRKTGFHRALVGNSGGIDSALVLSLCALELGADQVISVSMPGPYTSDETRVDSTELAKRWGIRHLEVPISEPYDTFAELLSGSPAARPGGLTVPQLLHELNTHPHKVANENLQSRLRGVTLMWLSNALSDQPTLVVTTGNKSELATGYCTLYGDMCGGLALISDVPKMMVYALARQINAVHGEKIPQSIIDREPSAELAPGQKDSDSLPPYPLLDEIVRLHVEEHLDAASVAAALSADRATVDRVVRLIRVNEYKRQQAAPGIKVTSKAFGIGRRMPIARGSVIP